MASKKKIVPPPQVSPSYWPLPPAVIGALLAAWSLFVFYCYCDRIPFNGDYLMTMLDQFADMHWLHPYVFKELVSILIAAWVSWISVEAGHRLLIRMVSSEQLSGFEDLAFSGGLGLALLSHLVLLLGAARLWYPGVFWLMLGTASLFFLIFRKSSFDINAGRFETSPGYWHRIWQIVAFGCFFIFLVGELTPEVFYDSLFYHIAIPNLYRISHRIYNTPTSLFSNYVLTVQRLYGLALTLWDETTAKLIHGAMAVLLACSFLGLARRFLSKGAGWLSIVLFFSMPLVGINVVTTGIDVGWCFFQVLAAAALVYALLQKERRWMALAGIFGGLSASCKYPGMTYLPIGCLLILWHRKWDEHLGWKVAIRDATDFAVCALLVLSPIFIKNMIFHQNPLYPIGALRWGTPRLDPHYWAIFQSEATIPNLKIEFGSFESAWRYLLHPWYLTMEGQSNGDFLGPLYLMALPFLFLLRAPSAGYKILRRYTVLLWLVWMVTSKTPRYGLPVLALFALLFAEVLIQACEKALVRFVVLSVVLLGAGTNLYHYLTIAYGTGGWQVLGGLIPKDQYLEQMHATYPTPPYEGILWMNDHLPPRSKILFTGDARNYYTRWPVIPSSVHDPDPLMQWSHEARDGRGLAETLRRQEVTHVYLNFAEAVRTEGYGIYHWDRAQWLVFNDFWNHYVELIWKKESNDRQNPQAQYVYRILSDEEAGRPHLPPPNPFQRWAKP